MRTISAAILAASMLVSGAFAADNAPLAAGKPAGTQQAQGIGSYVGPAILGGAVIGLIVYAAVYQNNDNRLHPSSTATGTNS